jgi:hypothetical protein
MLSIMISIFWVGFGFVGKKSDYEVVVIDKREQSVNSSIKSLKNNIC